MQQRYRQAAQELIKQGDYRRAAFIYLKLLKDPGEAAKTLEEGGLYQEAALIYLKYQKNKQKAAECYEKAHCLEEAISLYIELNKHEKAGDLYLLQGDVKTAHVFYDIAGEKLLELNKYVQASLLYRKKMGQPERAQDTLLIGWRMGRDAINCLNNYFVNIEDPEFLREQIHQLHQELTGHRKKVEFLTVIQHEYKKAPAFQEEIRDIAYEILSGAIERDPSLASQLLVFNPPDQHLTRDTIRYRNQ